MLLEYAIDPRVAADFDKLRFIGALFDYSTPRRVSRFPKAWQREVIREANKISDMNKARVTEYLEQMTDRKSCIRSFNRGYDGKKDWPANASLAHQQRPFKAIFSNDIDDAFIGVDDISDQHPLLRVQMPSEILKTLDNLVQTLAPVLVQAKHLYVIDPYFDPYNAQCRQLFDVLFGLLRERPDADMIEIKICTASNRDRSPYNEGDEGRFLNDLKARFTLGPLAESLEVRLVRYDRDMHARYFLSDDASLLLDNSLSVNDHQRLNITMMTLEHSDRIKDEFFGDHAR